MYNIKLENWKDCKEDAKKLIHAHWKEVAWYQDKMELDPIWEQYDNMYDINVFQPIMVRDESGNLVGYASYFVTPSLHYGSHLVADNDIIYIVPEHRHAGLAIELLNYCETTFRSMGVSVMTIKMKTDNTFHALMEHAQFSMMEYNYTKWIGV